MAWLLILFWPAVCSGDDFFDFLMSIPPKEEIKKETASPKPGCDSLGRPYYIHLQRTESGVQARQVFCGVDTRCKSLYGKDPNEWCSTSPKIR